MRTAVYAGTFDPITRGHISVMRRAATLFDRVVVVVAVNPNKAPLFDLDRRLAFIRDASAGFANIAATSTEGYIVTLAREIGATILVRGVRGASDIDSEIALAQANAQLAPEIETIFVPAEQRLAAVSSSELKRRVRAGIDVAGYCTPLVASELARALKRTHRQCARAGEST